MALVRGSSYAGVRLVILIPNGPLDALSIADVNVMPLIPYEFDPPSAQYEEAHLTFQDTPAGKLVSWPLIGASILLPRDTDYPEFSEIEKLNTGKFTAHGLFGFSLGRYHEFLVSMPNEKQVCFKMGDIEATFGDATPLAACLFSAYHREKWFGEWDTIFSLRITGAEHGEAEIAFINSCTAYDAMFGVLPDKFPMDDSLIIDQTFDLDSDYVAQTFVGPPIITNPDPLRFFYDGLSQSDEIAACIYFYRTLEYFSFFTNAAEMRRLRHDPSVSDVDFSRRILDLVSRDEKGPIFQLIVALIDENILTNSVSEGLISAPLPNQLCEAIYSFRNSIVHGKFSYGYSLQSGSVLRHDPQITKWRLLLRDLAKRALEQFGSKKT